MSNKKISYIPTYLYYYIPLLNIKYLPWSKLIVNLSIEFKTKDNMDDNNFILLNLVNYHKMKIFCHLADFNIYINIYLIFNFY